LNLFNAGVVARGKIIKAVRAGVLQKQPKFDKIVAPDTGIRCAAMPVFGNKILNDVLREFCLSVKNAMRDAEMATDSLRGTDITAQASCQLHGHPFDRKPLLLEQCRGNGAVHSAAHGYEYTFFHKKPKWRGFAKFVKSAGGFDRIKLKSFFVSFAIREK